MMSEILAADSFCCQVDKSFNMRRLYKTIVIILNVTLKLSQLSMYVESNAIAKCIRIPCSTELKPSTLPCLSSKIVLRLNEV